MTKRKTKFKIFATIGFLVLFGLLMLFLFSGGNLNLLRSLFLEDHTNEELRDKLSDFGVRGYITIVVLSMIQVVLTFIPAEPVQVLSGLAFGIPVGLLCCVIGVLLGSSLVFILYKAYGNKIRDYFMENLHLDFSKLAKSKRIALVVFILYFLPAIPYGMICFFAVSTGMKYHRYILITLIGAIPSELMGVALGHMAISASWIVSVIVFTLIIALLIVVMIKRDAIFQKINSYLDRPPYSSKTTVKSYKARRLLLPHFISGVILRLKGVRAKYSTKIDGKICTPSIVLVNHGSFIDFVYAGKMLRKKSPNFIVARLYFYKKIVGNLLRKFGCFPKSMFSQDIESARNCLRVLRGGGVLAMMPEARLSTVGRFEDIQPGTFDFLKQARVPVYTIKINGDYFADPKWGNGMRRGSVVYAELDILFTKEQLEQLTTEQVKNECIQRLYYDEFEWIKEHPEIRYKNKSLAKGLENILTLCPKCKSKYTLYTNKCEIFCEKCGKLAVLDNRYSFDTDAPFDNFASWFDWQKEEMRKEISANPDFALSSAVEFLLPSCDGKKMLRQAGEGVCTLDKTGLHYCGTRDGESCEIYFPMSEIYRLLFGAGENFEIYRGNEIHYFRPTERRSCVDWYIASMILSDEAKKP